MGRHCSGEGRGVGCPARKAEVPPLLGESLWERPLLSESLNFLWCGMRQSGSGAFLQLFLCSRDLISLCWCPGLTLMGSPCEETKQTLLLNILFLDLKWFWYGRHSDPWLAEKGPPCCFTPLQHLSHCRKSPSFDNTLLKMEQSSLRMNPGSSVGLGWTGWKGILSRSEMWGLVWGLAQPQSSWPVSWAGFISFSVCLVPSFAIILWSLICLAT